MTPGRPPHSWTRRRFLATAACAATLAGCDSGADGEDLLFDGPVINEADFVRLNARYYNQGIDSATQLPYNEIRGTTPRQETDPVAIAYRLQFLLENDLRREEVDTILTHMLSAQRWGFPPNHFRNMLPRLTLSGGSLQPATLEYSFVDNAVLAARVAMAAQQFAGTDTGNKALEYLNNLNRGFSQAYSQSSGFLPAFGAANQFRVDPTGINLLFGADYASIAFVLAHLVRDSRFVSDPSAGLTTWANMIAAQNTYISEHPASTASEVNIHAPLARNGSAFQYFHSMLVLEPDAIPATLRAGLYNVLFSYLDAAVYDRVPGIYSAGPYGAGFLTDNGLNRLAARQRLHGSQETVVTVDALAAALRLFPEDSDERLILRGWIALYATVGGAVGEDGFYGSMDLDGNPFQAMYARQNGPMILFKSNTVSLLNSFLRAQGRPDMNQLIGQVHLIWSDAPLARVEQQLPVPLREERLFFTR